jgi:pyrroloquinoline quinone biosynthesis protein E
VVQNVTDLNNLSKLMGKEVTKMWTVVQDKNIDQLKELIDLAKQMNFSSMVFSLDISDWGNEGWTDRNEQRSVGRTFDLGYANNLYNYGLDQGIKVAFWNINEKYDILDPNKLCEWPFERSYIASDSRIVPCCMVADPDTFEIKGSIKEQSEGGSLDKEPNWSFVEIWNSKNYKNFRKSHLSGDASKLPKICQGCYKSGVKKN